MSQSIAFLGPKATFTDLAVSRLFPDDTKIAMSTIPECLDAVSEGQTDLAVVPIENALEGSVNITLDYLVHEVDLPIRGEIITPIQQHIMVHPDNDSPAFLPETIYSHSHAIAQCHKFLHKELSGIRCENTTSTAAAAKIVKENPERKIAAIANEMAAQEYGLQITKHNIHDFSHNHTKFVVLSKSEVQYKNTTAVPQGYKTTLMVMLPADHSGALHQVLSAFAWRKLNLSKIESRPMKTGLGNYIFIIDLEMKMDDVLVPGAISELEALGCKVSLLGSYPSFMVEEAADQAEVSLKTR
ncbi:prephenate dehydratase [Peribacillus cavernae]|uniref:Prephenate dehydratase n=1 Tax=Peribacillus cavernae TaxID=1674310 RepID=A0A433HHR3_9BACI|nr:prephenate dehydratase [Peribacillus cavernae]MDQ0219358.1 prephenate dehydratase [Peribacillus cavernae]RUQ27765.1 prephenate dehydratase [Peribacillus cavernae]